MKIVLASSSEYRKALLARLNLEFLVQSPEIDEQAQPAESGRDLACRLAKEKAVAVASWHDPETFVIGSDQVAECNEELLGKPLTKDRAVDQLLKLSGQEVTFHTAMAISHCGKVELAYVATQIGLRALSREEIIRYVDQDHPLNCSGALKTESLGISLMTHFSSEDPTAIIGLPLIELCQSLRRAGVNLP